MLSEYHGASFTFIHFIHFERIIIFAFVDDEADGHQLEFSLRLPRRRKLYKKFQLSFSDYPIVHTRNLTANKACAEGPWTVLVVRFCFVRHLYTKYNYACQAWEVPDSSARGANIPLL